MTSPFTRFAATALMISVSAPALAQNTVRQLRTELSAARAEITAQRAQLDAQEARLRALEARVSEQVAVAAVPPSGLNALQGSASTVPGDPSGVVQAPIEQVGAAPADFDRPPQLAVLGDEGNVVTRAGQLMGEAQFEYARADRNRAVFRGVEVVESVLVGVFDINESRQDVLTTAATLRYGLLDNLEIGVRLPFVYRSDTSILAPIAGAGSPSATIDTSAKGRGIGDLEVSARYQLTRARRGLPFLIANLQAVFPTGTDPFSVPRDANGIATKAATGAGFYGISPSLTAILPTDPAVLFGTIGYTFNLAKDVNTAIPPVVIEYVDPGDSISGSAGIGISLNQRTSLNLGYAHTWAFGTKTRTRLINPPATGTGVQRLTSRDLQIGRFLFGVTYRVSDRASLNWSVEVGATDDATDLRTVVRIPLVLLTGSD